jgi:hypothetical protein
VGRWGTVVVPGWGTHRHLTFEGRFSPRPPIELRCISRSSNPKQRISSRRRPETMRTKHAISPLHPIRVISKRSTSSTRPRSRHMASSPAITNHVNFATLTIVILASVSIVIGVLDFDVDVFVVLEEGVQVGQVDTAADKVAAK